MCSLWLIFSIQVAERNRGEDAETIPNIKGKEYSFHNFSDATFCFVPFVVKKCTAFDFLYKGRKEMS